MIVINSLSSNNTWPSYSSLDGYTGIINFPVIDDPYLPEIALRIFVCGSVFDLNMNIGFWKFDRYVQHWNEVKKSQNGIRESFVIILNMPNEDRLGEHSEFDCVFVLKNKHTFGYYLLRGVVGAYREEFGLKKIETTQLLALLNNDNFEQDCLTLLGKSNDVDFELLIRKY
ncbi:MAG: hypothetical protein JKY48_01700 [Flavobacteriales bacterium]|nr:hypothetical protein [Flavobacteriales bacterium]